MSDKVKGINTVCIHSGELHDLEYGGAVSPLYMATSYDYQVKSGDLYPRYFNTPNQQALCQKISDLEHCEASLIFGSGMAAITNALMAFLHSGDHIVVQTSIYGGTYHFLTELCAHYGISHDFVDGSDQKAFSDKIKSNTKVIYIESPSNPLLEVIDLNMISALAKSRDLVSIIDNTMASPVNQNPALFGVDVVVHSATKYMGGHSDILAGTISCSKAHRDRIFSSAKMFGANLSDYTIWLLERSIKTMGLRVACHNANAQFIAEWLEAHPNIAKVHYPGLKSHASHEIAKRQMKGFSGVISFELAAGLNAEQFLEALRVIKRSLSFAGVESTALLPAATSHSIVGEQARKTMGISDHLIRLSVGIEDVEDLIRDITQAINVIK